MASLVDFSIVCQFVFVGGMNNITKNMGRGLSIIRRCAGFLTSTSVVQVIQALVLSHLDYCPAVWSSAVKKDLRKLQLVQNRTEGQARLALQCRNRSNILHMHNADLGSW